MSTVMSRAGLTLGAIGIVLSGAARADDFRPNQSLLESGLLLSQTEADAVYARLDAARPQTSKPTPGTVAFWESGAVGLNQGDRAGRLAWSGSATQMRIGADREIDADLIVGAVAGAGFGDVGSGGLTATTLSRHVDVYARFGSGAFFANALVGGSSYSFDDVVRDSNRGDTTGYGMRAGGQLGGSLDLAGVKVTPSIAMTATGHALQGYRESGPGAVEFADRQAGAATATMRLAGKKKLKFDPTHAIDVTGFVGADEMVAFKASALKANVAGVTESGPSMASPTGRGVFGGLGVETAIAEGVTMKLDYDYGLRDGVATKTGRARVGVSF